MKKPQHEDIVVLRVKKSEFQKAAADWQSAKTVAETRDRLLKWISVCETQNELDSIWAHVTNASEKNAFRARMNEIKSRESAKADFLARIPV